jgi:Septum formation
MQPAADGGVDPDVPTTDAASTSTDGWTPPPWTAGPDTQADWTPPPWTAGPDAQAGRYIPTGWWRLDGFRIVGLIVAALLLVGVVVGGNINASRSTTSKPEVAPAEPTQVHTEVATPDEIDESEDLNWDEYNIDDSVDLRVGDCFDLKDPSAEIEHVKAVPCKTEHDYELFYVGAMAKGSHPTAHAFATYLMQNCNPAFGAYIGKAYKDSDLDYIWLVPTEDAWRSGDRTVQCAVNDPNNFLLKGSLRGAHR